MLSRAPYWYSKSHEINKFSPSCSYKLKIHDIIQINIIRYLRGKNNFIYHSRLMPISVKFFNIKINLNIVLAVKVNNKITSVVNN